jgi:hypothetical protein
MADFAKIIRDSVAKIDGITKSAQTSVVLTRWNGQSYDGTPTYAAPLTVQAIVQYKQEQRQSPSGQTRVSKAYVVVVSPLLALGAANRSEPVDERDLVTLPNMTTGPILETAGIVDPATGLPYMHEIWLGDRRGDF